MATKEKLRTRAARLREEARETGKVVLRAPALVRGAECVIRALLGALLAGAEIFGGYAPFGLGLVGASGSGLGGFCALAGACFGYLTMQGFSAGLRYAAACILTFSVAFAFFDVQALPPGLVHAPGRRGHGRRHRLCLSLRPGVDGGGRGVFRHRAAAVRGVGLLLPDRLLPLGRGAGGGV